MTACGSDHPLTLLDSDVPTPPEMDVRYSFDIVKSGGALSGGRFILSGEVESLADAAEETVQRYSTNGWSLRERRMQTAQALLVFEKGGRTVTVDIQKRRVDPEMSSAVVVVDES
jgi:hypothetical protein